MNVYESCPVLTTPHFTLRLVSLADAPGLLQVYSDPTTQRCINADNCTSDFRYSTLKEMEGCINMWLWSYKHGHFVRWTILHGETPIGTVEMFRRNEENNGTGVLRLDLHSRFETTDTINELLQHLLPSMHTLFSCECVLTKSLPTMHQRCTALKNNGFAPCTAPIIGHGGIELPHYWARRHKLA